MDSCPSGRSSPGFKHPQRLAQTGLPSIDCLARNFEGFQISLSQSLVVEASLSECPLQQNSDALLPVEQSPVAHVIEPDFADFYVCDHVPGYVFGLPLETWFRKPFSRCYSGSEVWQP